MIYVYYYKLDKRLSNFTFNQLLQPLPEHIQSKILRFRNWQDAERSLSGYTMLIRALAKLGKNNLSLQSLNYSQFQKPYFNESVNFNISHSGLYTICAISEINKIGVDVEEIGEIKTDDFKNLFSNQEWEEVIYANHKYTAFYTLWTKKEAFLKLIGCGLNQPLNKVVIKNNKIVWDIEEFFLHEIVLDTQHIAYLCTDEVSPVIKLEETIL